MIQQGRITEKDFKKAVIEEFVVGAQVNFNFFYSPLTKEIELLGTDMRRQTNIDGILTTKPEVLHAESNAITKLAKSTGSCDGATLYTTLSPCLECAKLIIQCGIKRVVYLTRYRSTNGLDLLEKANIKVVQSRRIES